MIKKEEKILNLKAFKTLQDNIRRIFDINSINMFCSMHDFMT